MDVNRCDLLYIFNPSPRRNFYGPLLGCHEGGLHSQPVRPEDLHHDRSQLGHLNRHIHSTSDGLEGT